MLRINSRSGMESKDLHQLRSWDTTRTGPQKYSELLSLIQPWM